MTRLFNLVSGTTSSFHRASDTDICINCPLPAAACESSSQGESVGKVKKDYPKIEPICLRDFAMLQADDKNDFRRLAALAPRYLNPDDPASAGRYKAAIARLKNVELQQRKINPDSGQPLPAGAASVQPV